MSRARLSLVLALPMTLLAACGGAYGVVRSDASFALPPPNGYVLLPATDASPALAEGFAQRLGENAPVHGAAVENVVPEGAVGVRVRVQNAQILAGEEEVTAHVDFVDSTGQVRDEISVRATKPSATRGAADRELGGELADDVSLYLRERGARR